MLIDTHCHLHHQVFENKIARILSDAQTAGIEKIISPGVDLASSKKNIALAKKYKGVYAAVGIHPVDVKTGSLHIEQKVKQLEKLIKTNRKFIVAVGETGLDFSPPPPGEKSRPKQEQIALFQAHIRLAVKYKLPLIIHNRMASEELIKTINYQQSTISYRLCGVFHCFQGNKRLLNWAFNHNFFIGITGLVSYDSNMQQLVKQAPLTNLLLETDAPFLTPEPLKSQKIFPNKPKNVKIIANWIAKLKGDSFLNIEKQTTKNTLNLFNLYGKK